MTTRETRVALGNLSQQRISQLVRKGVLVVERDANGAYQYDRLSVELEAKRRALHSARDETDAAEKEAMQAEARDRFRRQRQREREAEEARQRHLDELREREVTALEGIWNCLRQR